MVEATPNGSRSPCMKASSGRFQRRCSQPSFFLLHCSKSYRTIERAVSISASTSRAGRKLERNYANCAPNWKIQIFWGLHKSGERGCRFAHACRWQIFLSRLLPFTHVILVHSIRERLVKSIEISSISGSIPGLVLPIVPPRRVTEVLRHFRFSRTLRAWKYISHPSRKRSSRTSPLGQAPTPNT